MKLSDDERALLAARRARVLAAMGEGVMLLPAASERLRSGDTHYPFRQDSDFGYVTGVRPYGAVGAVDAPGSGVVGEMVLPRSGEQLS